MKGAYFSEQMDCVADITDMGLYFGKPNQFYINGIVTKQEHRGKGLARQVLKDLLADADKEGIILVVEINPYGDMNYEQLKEWYKRNGFIELKDKVFKRFPE